MTFRETPPTPFGTGVFQMLGCLLANKANATRRGLFDSPLQVLAVNKIIIYHSTIMNHDES